jgi:hypothetical protein
MNPMKTIRYILLLVTLFLNVAVNAQMPRTISYQGVLADASGNFISDGNHTLTLKLYNASGAVQHSETQTVVVVKGLFNVLIGSTSGLPSNLSFDKPYFLGVSVDGGAELTPRTPLSASPYALRAQVAEEAMSLSPSASGVVRSINNRSGSLRMVGAGGTTVSLMNDTILVSSSGGGGAAGVQGIQNSDGALSITNPNGPTSTINITPGGITTSYIMDGTIITNDIQDLTISSIDIADGAVTPSKIFSAGITNGFVLTKTAGGASWSALPSSSTLTLPYLNALANTSTLFDVTATGTGRVGSFKINNGNNAVPALVVETNGSGSALSAAITNNNSSSDVISASTNGSGSAGAFSSTLISSTTAALSATSGSTADGSTELSGAAAINAVVSSSSSGAYSVGIRGINNGLDDDGYGVLGYHAGSGVGVKGATPAGIGVLGQTTDETSGVGVHGISAGSSGIGVNAEYSGSNTAGIAQQVTNGYIKVSGGRRSAFPHFTTIGNSAQNRTTLNYPGMAQTDMLFVTHVFTNGLINAPVGVVWNNNAWHVYLENNGNMPVGETFNILVIKQ